MYTYCYDRTDNSIHSLVHITTLHTHSRLCWCSDTSWRAPISWRNPCQRPPWSSGGACPARWGRNTVPAMWYIVVTPPYNILDDKQGWAHSRPDSWREAREWARPVGGKRSTWCALDAGPCPPAAGWRALTGRGTAGLCNIVIVITSIYASYIFWC